MKRRRPRLRRFVSLCMKLGDKTQVELHGQYLGDNLVAFHEYYTRTSLVRVVGVCLLTPLPVIIAIILMDCIPLTHPEQGPNVVGVWLRVIFTAGIDASCLACLCQAHVGWVRLSLCFIIGIGIAAGVSTALLCWLVAQSTGLPIPFLMFLGTPTVTLPVAVVIYWTHKQHMRNIPHAMRSLMSYFHVFFCQSFITVIYPMYNHVFVTLPSNAQTAVLPVPGGNHA